MEQSNDTLENVMIKLINNQPFYANLLMQMTVVFDAKLPTLGVTIVNNQPTLLINKDFFNQYNLDTKCLLLIHECDHLMLGHLYERRERFAKKDYKLANMAMDTAIHEIETKIKNNKNLSEIVCSVENFNSKYDLKLENHKNTEYYFDKLKELSDSQQKQQGDSSDSDMGDSHDTHDWEDIDTDVAKNVTHDALQKAIDSTKEGKGEVPNEALLTVEKLKKNKVNWRSVLRRYVGSNIEINKKVSRNRRNRRYEDLRFPGKRKGDSPRIVNIIDTSGSMSVDELNQVWAELAKLEKLGHEIFVIEADCVVSKQYKFKDRKFTGFTGGGGTAYQPGITAAMGYKPDLIVYFGDMDSADTPNNPGVPFLWLTTKNQKPPASFGKVVSIVD